MRGVFFEQSSLLSIGSPNPILESLAYRHVAQDKPQNSPEARDRRRLHQHQQKARHEQCSTQQYEIHKQSGSLRLLITAIHVLIPPSPQCPLRSLSNRFSGHRSPLMIQQRLCQMQQHIHDEISPELIECHERFFSIPPNQSSHRCHPFCTLLSLLIV